MLFHKLSIIYMGHSLLKVTNNSYKFSFLSKSYDKSEKKILFQDVISLQKSSRLLLKYFFNKAHFLYYIDSKIFIYF